MHRASSPADNGQQAVDELLSLGERAYALRLVGAARDSQRWNADADGRRRARGRASRRATTRTSRARRRRRSLVQPRPVRRRGRAGREARRRARSRRAAAAPRAAAVHVQRVAPRPGRLADRVGDVARPRARRHQLRARDGAAAARRVSTRSTCRAILARAAELAGDDVDASSRSRTLATQLQPAARSRSSLVEPLLKAHADARAPPARRAAWRSPGPHRRRARVPRAGAGRRRRRGRSTSRRCAAELAQIIDASRGRSRCSRRARRATGASRARDDVGDALARDRSRATPQIDQPARRAAARGRRYGGRVAPAVVDDRARPDGRARATRRSPTRSSAQGKVAEALELLAAGDRHRPDEPDAAAAQGAGADRARPDRRRRRAARADRERASGTTCGTSTVYQAKNLLERGKPKPAP